ncbi:hypothetical protein [Paenibacillus solani]|uniref:Uncharacterized protein n=1 Tax=Paenibacillus solani TaxID=1705565 RepID=A0A0M1P156_9BACL|nr:hypothetical protein [Paenibacillus solani]KOR88117.1 hypothetical protein AM231_02465 [Paenibacillus solani]
MSRTLSLLISFILIIIIIFYPTMVNATGDITKDITYEMSKDSDDYEYGGYLFSDNKQLSTKPISVKAPDGKIIKKLEWIDKSTGATIRSFKDFTPGKSEWTDKTDTLSGTKTKVRSEENTNYGGVYYWDRWSIFDAGNWYGKHWRASGGTVSKRDSRGCDDSAATENVQGNALPKYPNCTDDALEAKILELKRFMSSMLTLHSIIYGLKMMEYQKKRLRPRMLELIGTH